MELADFSIGTEFTCGDGLWRCTDVGSRTVAAIRIDGVVSCDGSGEKVLTRGEAEEDGWFNGPPYAVAETVFDEDDMAAMEPAGEPAMAAPGRF